MIMLCVTLSSAFVDCCLLPRCFGFADCWMAFVVVGLLPLANVDMVAVLAVVAVCW